MVAFIIKRGNTPGVHKISVVYRVYRIDAIISRSTGWFVRVNKYEWYRWSRDPVRWRVRVKHDNEDWKLKEFENEVQAETWVYSRAKALGAEL